jgi:hypothetical protein
MTLARTDFITRIDSLNKSVSSDSVKSKSITPENEDHNSIAKLLRNGLAVVSFASLEDFIKQRSAEAMSEIGGIGIEFTDLPEKLQQAATYEAIKAFGFQLSFRDKTEKISYVQEHAFHVASTSNSTFQLSPHTFAHAQSNVTADTIRKVLGCFNVKNPWLQMTRLASMLGLTALPLEETYKAASQRRHKAAHSASTDTPQSDVKQFVNEAFAIAISFDLLLTKALQKFSSGDADYLNSVKEITSENISFRMVRFKNNSWKEYRGTSTRAYRSSQIQSTIVTNSIARAENNKEAYVQFTKDNLIKDWRGY